MRVLAAWLLLFVLSPAVRAPAQQPTGPRTMRLDFAHSGDATTEELSVERIVLEPLPWPGNPNRPLDTTNLGPYRFEVIDRETNRAIYSRGFASIFAEWQSTSEAREMRRAFSESLRFPAPSRPVRMRIEKRTATNDFVEIASVVVDPTSPGIDRSAPPSPGELITIQQAGEPAHKVDLLLLGDGYTATERAKFERDARRLAAELFEHSPFKEHREEFNVWALAPAAAESGISRPSTGVYRRSPVGATYDVFGSERYVLTYDNRAFRDVASFAPYDFVEILVNGETYGGGGIFGLYGTVAADSAWAPYVFVHEFGHHFAALADEYYTSPVAYETTGGAAHREPWEKNVTADPQAPKWKDLLTPGVPLPTPWKKTDYESFQREIQARRRTLRAERRPEAEMNALFEEERTHATRLLGGDTHSSKVGAFEGASYEAKGLYRSQEDCIMFTRDDAGFCAVCRRAIEEVIALYTQP